MQLNKKISFPEKKQLKTKQIHVNEEDIFMMVELN